MKMTSSAEMTMPSSRAVKLQGILATGRAAEKYLALYHHNWTPDVVIKSCVETLTVHCDSLVTAAGGCGHVITSSWVALEACNGGALISLIWHSSLRAQRLGGALAKPSVCGDPLGVSFPLLDLQLEARQNSSTGDPW